MRATMADFLAIAIPFTAGAILLTAAFTSSGPPVLDAAGPTRVQVAPTVAAPAVPGGVEFTSVQLSNPAEVTRDASVWLSATDPDGKGLRNQLAAAAFLVDSPDSCASADRLPADVPTHRVGPSAWVGTVPAAPHTTTTVCVGVVMDRSAGNDVAGEATRLAITVQTN